MDGKGDFRKYQQYPLSSILCLCLWDGIFIGGVGVGLSATVLITIGSPLTVIILILATGFRLILATGFRRKLCRGGVAFSFSASAQPPLKPANGFPKGLPQSRNSFGTEKNK